MPPAAVFVVSVFVLEEVENKEPASSATFPKLEALSSPDFAATDARVPAKPLAPPLLLPKRAGTIEAKSSPGTDPSLETLSPARPAAAAAIPDNTFNADVAIDASYFFSIIYHIPANFNRYFILLSPNATIRGKIIKFFLAKTRESLRACMTFPSGL
jgi:hypothetical protein